MYINLCAAVKLWIDEKDAGLPTHQHSREEIHALYKSLPTTTEFEHVTKKEFKEIFEQRRGQKKTKKQVDTSVLQRMFISLGPPPPPTAS